jgi:hypothetical protein
MHAMFEGPRRCASPQINRCGRPGPTSPSAQHGGGGASVAAAGDEATGGFRSDISQAGWLWKRFGHGYTSTWRRLWVREACAPMNVGRPLGAWRVSSSRPTLVPPEPGQLTGRLHGGHPAHATHLPQFQLCEDRLCYQDEWERDASGDPGMEERLPASYAGAGSPLGNSGAVHYLPLDRIPVRPLPHRQHVLDPLEGSHPDVGIAIIDNRWDLCSRGPVQAPLAGCFCGLRRREIRHEPPQVLPL